MTISNANKVITRIGFIVLAIGLVLFVCLQFVSITVRQELVPIDPLSLAIDGGAPVDEIMAILDADVSLSAKPSVYGMHPIAHAVSANRADIVLLLLQRGADPNVAGPLGLGSPLSLAAKDNNVELGRILLEHGADPESGILGMTVRQMCQDESHRDFRDLLDSHENKDDEP